MIPVYYLLMDQSIDLKVGKPLRPIEFIEDIVFNESIGGYEKNGDEFVQAPEEKRFGPRVLMNDPETDVDQFSRICPSGIQKIQNLRSSVPDFSRRIVWTAYIGLKFFFFVSKKKKDSIVALSLRNTTRAFFFTRGGERV